MLRTQHDVDVVGLLTAVNQTVARVAMHAVREDLLDPQAAATGLPLIKVPLPLPCSTDRYENTMHGTTARARAEGITQMAFGNLFLEDVRQYPERRLAGTGIEPIFPLWGQSTGQLATCMVASGLYAHLTCVDPNQFDPVFAGRPSTSGC